MIAKKQALTRDKEEYVKPVYPGLQIAYYNSYFSKETYTYVDWHWHHAFQYALVTKGQVAFQTPNNTTILEEGEGVFINYKQPHLIKAANDEKSSYMCLEIGTDIIDNDPNGRMYRKYISPFLEHDSIQLMVFRQDTDYGRNIISSMKRIADIADGEENCPELKIWAEALNIWENTMGRFKLPGSTTQGMDYNVNHRLRQIFRYISMNYKQKITLDEIAAHINLSRSECSRFFHKSTGQSLFDFITNYRIGQSLILLEENQLSIADIASEVGFSGQSYYTKIFKERRGITPKEYRTASHKLSDVYTKGTEK